MNLLEGIGGVLERRPVTAQTTSSLKLTFASPHVVLATAVLLFSWLSTAALAHASLVSEAPAANSIAKPPPTELRLKFSEAIEVKFANVKVIGPDRKEIETRSPKLDPGDKTVLIVPLVMPLADGKYTVEWQVVSVDGHKTKGSYGFDATR